MNFLAQAKITEDNYIIMRVKACAASKGIKQPHEWTMANVWHLAAQPGWGTAYGKALDKEDTTEPAAWGGVAGADTSVITDQMINDAVDNRLQEEKAEVEEAKKAAEAEAERLKQQTQAAEATLAASQVDALETALVEKIAEVSTPTEDSQTP